MDKQLSVVKPGNLLHAIRCDVSLLLTCALQKNVKNKIERWSTVTATSGRLGQEHTQPIPAVLWASSPDLRWLPASRYPPGARPRSQGAVRGDTGTPRPQPSLWWEHHTTGLTFPTSGVRRWHPWELDASQGDRTPEWYTRVRHMVRASRADCSQDPVRCLL